MDTEYAEDTEYTELKKQKMLLLFSVLGDFRVFRVKSSQPAAAEFGVGRLGTLDTEYAEGTEYTELQKQKMLLLFSVPGDFRVFRVKSSQPAAAELRIFSGMDLAETPTA